MILSRALDHDAEPLSWTDIEALPYYIFGVLAVIGAVYALAEAGPILQTTTAKAVLILGMLGLRHAWIGKDH